MSFGPGYVGPMASRSGLRDIEPPDDDDYDDEPERRSSRIAEAIAVVAIGAVFTELIEWGVDELRDRFGSKERDEKKPTNKKPNSKRSKRR